VLGGGGPGSTPPGELAVPVAKSRAGPRWLFGPAERDAGSSPPGGEEEEGERDAALPNAPPEHRPAAPGGLGDATAPALPVNTAQPQLAQLQVGVPRDDPASPELLSRGEIHPRRGGGDLSPRLLHAGSLPFPPSRRDFPRGFRPVPG